MKRSLQRSLMIEGFVLVEFKFYSCWHASINSVSASVSIISEHCNNLFIGLFYLNYFLHGMKLVIIKIAKSYTYLFVDHIPWNV